MRTIRLKATINYCVAVDTIIEVSEDDNRTTLHEKAKELALIGIESNPNLIREVKELYISDIDNDSNPIIWVRP